MIALVSGMRRAKRSKRLPERMLRLLKALRGAAGAEIVPAELLSQLLVAVHDP